MADYVSAFDRHGQSIAALSPPRDMPVVVISSGDQPPDQITAHRALTESSLAGRHVIAASSGHWIQFDQPDLIIDVIRQLVDSTRTGERNRSAGDFERRISSSGSY